MGPVDFELVEVLEEMNHGNHGVREVGDDDEKVAAVLAWMTRTANGSYRDPDNEDCAEPDEPMRAKLFRCPFEFVVGEMPLQVDEAPRDLGDKADQQETKELVFFAIIDRVDPETTSFRRSLSDTVMYLDAATYANGDSVAVARRQSRVEKQAATRAALLKSAADVFERRGYASASVEEITERAGFSRGAFYSNFDTKDELFVALIESRIEGSLSDIAAAFAAGDTAADRIRSGGEFLDALVAKDRQWCLLYLDFWSRAVRDAKLRRRFAAQYDAWRSGISGMIEGQTRELGIALDASPVELASALIALFEGYVLQRLIDPGAFEEGFFTRLLLRFFARFGVDVDGGRGRSGPRRAARVP